MRITVSLNSSSLWPRSEERTELQTSTWKKNKISFGESVTWNPMTAIVMVIMIAIMIITMIVTFPSSAVMMAQALLGL